VKARRPSAATARIDMKAPDDQDSVLARFMEGPALLERALAGLQDAELDAPPSRGGWTIRQIVHHIVDGDDVWKMGIKQALGTEQAEFSLDWYRAQPQEAWAEKWAYANRSLDVSLNLLRAIRNHVEQLLEQVPDGWHRSVGFRTPDGEIERLTVRAIVRMQADHVEHHVKRIRAIRSEVEGA
jgi:uncharacterized damage-inducible protein DinB